MEINSYQYPNSYQEDQRHRALIFFAGISIAPKSPKGDFHKNLFPKSEDSLVHYILVADFVPGVYIMRISGGTGVAYRKVVVE